MERKLTLVGHLTELRGRLIIALVSLGIGSILSLPFASNLLKILKLPAGSLIGKLAFFSPQDAFLIYMRIAFLCGLIISMPLILYQVWAFISPAIDEKLKRYSSFFVAFCSILFIAGALFAYFILIPPAIKFLLSFGKEDLEPVISASKYISFVVTLILGCGFVFQMPAISVILTKAGIISASGLRKQYKVALVIILIVAAIITPTPDAFNMLVLALPMLVLYEISIWASWYFRPKLK